MVWRFLPLWTGLLACSGGEQTPAVDPEPVPTVPTGARPDAADAEGGALPLWTLPFAALEIPESSRQAPPERIPVDGPWEYTGTTKRGMHRYERPLPFRPRGLFFNTPEPGLSLLADGEAVPYDRFGSDDWLWFHDRDTLLVYRSERTEPPPGTLELVYDKATRRERALNHAFAREDAGGELPAEEFVWTTVQDGWNSRRGLLLPAPATASWTLEVPAAAELHFVAGIVEPEIVEGTSSDGAELTLRVKAGEGPPTELLATPLSTGRFVPYRLDLSKWAGQEVELSMTTAPGSDTRLDYAFIAEPVVATRKEDPRRVVMVFIDTLRPDRMSLYGYERDTSAKLDAVLADDAVVFSQARSVAPWTLPSSRTIVTGRQPEDYGRSETVQGLLRDRGWATAFLAANVYLSANFDMHRDWDHHRVGLWPPAEQMTDDALQWLEAHDGRDAILQVHYMDPHLPYVEPPEYREMYADAEPKGGLRDEFHLSDVRRAKLVERGLVDAQTWIADRYDNNVRYATDQVARLIEHLDDDDIVLVYADHGEELFDHANFEHGHSLFDELLRVPLVVRAPGLEGARIDTPVSLLDIAPTVLDLVDVDVPPEMEGRSLVPLARAEPAAVESFAARDLTFGRPLYGNERWGVLHGTQKWTTHEGREALYDVGADPDETTNLMVDDNGTGGALYRDILEDNLGRDVVTTWRMATTAFKGRKVHELKVWCSVPGGFAEAWAGALPLMNADIRVEKLTAAEVRQAVVDNGFPPEELPVTPDAAGLVATWTAGMPGAGEVFMLPARDMAEVGYGLRCSGLQNDKRATMGIRPPRNPALTTIRTPFDRIHFEESRQLLLQYGIAPLPAEGVIDGTDDEMTDALKAIGYVDPDEEEAGGE